MAAAISDYLGVSEGGQLPTLPSPFRGGLSLESLIVALGAEERKSAVTTGLDTLEIRKKEMEENQEKRLKEMQTRLEKMEKKNVASKFLKAFKYIGIVLGAVAGVATFFAGIATANPVLAAGGFIMAIMAADSILTEATDGKICINNAMYLLAKKCGGSETAAKWTGIITTLVIQLVGCVLTFGAGVFGWGSKAAVQGASAATEAATTATKSTFDKVTKVSTLVASGLQGLISIGTAGTGLYVASLEKAIGYSLANTKELNAILEKVKAAMEVERDLLEAVLKKNQSLVEKTTEIIKANNEAQTAVLTGGAFSSPSMA
jgi:hypothetical protein